MKDNTSKSFSLTRSPIRIFVAPILTPSEPIRYGNRVFRLAPKAFGVMVKVKGHDVACVACDPSYSTQEKTGFVLSVLHNMFNPKPDDTVVIKHNLSKEDLDTVRQKIKSDAMKDEIIEQFDRRNGQVVIENSDKECAFCNNQ